jgi:hypothetical protein
MAAYKIERTGLLRMRRRLVADAVLSPADFDAIARELGIDPRRARKEGQVAARRVTQDGSHAIVWAGEKTKNEAKIGDWLVTNLDTKGEPLKDNGIVNQYVIKPDKFAQRYKRAPGESRYGANFVQQNAVVAETLLFEGGIDIMAPWGERQTLETGYLLKTSGEVYGNADKSFRSTYVFMS